MKLKPPVTVTLLIFILSCPLFSLAKPASTPLSRLNTENRIGAMTRDPSGVIRDLWLTDGIRFFGSDEWILRRFLERYPDACCGSVDDLVLSRKLSIEGGSILWLQQTIHGRPVFRAGIMAEVSNGRVTVLANRTEVLPETLGPFSYPDRSRVTEWLLGGRKDVTSIRLYRLDQGVFHGTASVRVWVSDETGDWERILDAKTGRERFRRSLRHHDYNGYVYVTNPVSATGDPSLTDMDDRTSDVLDAARTLVTLLPPSPSGQLKNQFVDLSAPGMLPGSVAGYHPGMAMGDNGSYLYDRDDVRFEEVNVYYWVSRASSRIANELGFPQAVNYPIPVNVHFMTADNSYYLETDRGLHFGDGGVDDAEDAEIVLHEYGHAVIHNLVPGLGGGWESSALDEGTCDYIAASFGNDTTYPDTIGEWDATAYDASGLEPPRLRPIVTDRVYPDNMREPYPQPWSMKADFHWDGVIWSATLWQAREHLGADVMDRIVLRGITTWYPDISYAGAAVRLLNAEQALYGGLYGDTIRYTLTRRGLLTDSYIVKPEAVQLPYQLVFPLPRKTGDTHAEIGVVNLGSQEAELRYQVIGDNGCRVYPRASVVLPEKGRLFVDPLNGRTLDGCWVYLESDQPVAGYTRIMSGSPDKSAFVPASTGTADTLVVPHIAVATDYWDTFTTLIHTGADPVTVQFEDGGSGLEIPEVTDPYRLDNWEWFSERYAGTFPEGFSGWGRFVADMQELAGMELFGKKGEGVHQLAGLDLTSEPSDRMFFAHVAAETGYWWTGIVVCNVSDQPVTVWLTARAVSGDELDTVTFTLGPWEKKDGLVADFWTGADSPYPQGTAWLDLRANHPSIVGVELFGTLPESGDRLLAGLSPATDVANELVFPHVDDNVEDFWTGVAWVNAGTASTTVRVTALDDNGMELAAVSLTDPVPAGGKVVMLVRDMFGGVIPVGTTQVRVRGDQPLAGFELWGNLTPKQDYVSGMLAVPVSPVPLSSQ